MTRWCALLLLMTFAVTSCTSTPTVVLPPETTSAALPPRWTDPGDYLDIVPVPAGWRYTNNGVDVPLVPVDLSPDCVPRMSWAGISGELEGTANWFAPAASDSGQYLTMISMSAESFDEPGAAHRKADFLNQMLHECPTLQLSGDEISMRPLDLTLLGHPVDGFEGAVMASSSSFEQWSVWVAKDNLLVVVWMQAPTYQPDTATVVDFLSAALEALDA